MLTRLLGFVAALLALVSASRAATIRLPDKGKVQRVVDGDTVVVKADGKEYKVRLIGVDTPEAHDSDKLDRDAERARRDKQFIVALGKKATEFTRALCEGRSCMLRYDPANEEKGHRDTYGRLLAYLWVRHKGRRLLVNAELIRHGYATAIVKFPYDKRLKKRFGELQEEARARRRGLWGRRAERQKPEGDEPPLVASKRGGKYHRPDCTAAKRILPKNRIEFKDAKEAEAAGYEPCKLCNPG